MEQGTAMDLTKFKKIVADIQKFPAKIDSTEQAQNAKHLLKKYALLSEKIERNVLITAADQKSLAKIRTKEFKAIRQTLKETANSILHAKNNKVQSNPVAKKPVKSATPKKAVDAPVAKKTTPKKLVKKASPQKTTDAKKAS